MISMKKSLRVMTAIGALTLLCVGSASAANLGVGTVTADGGLRLRAEANTTSAILNTAYNGETVVVLEEAEDGWYKVDYKSVEGYMFGEYLDIETTIETDLGYGEVNVDSVLNVRSGPGTDYDKLGTLSAGTVVEITGMEDGWYHIAYGEEKAGYVSSDYIVLCQDQYGTKGEEAAVAASDLEAQIVAYAKEFLGVPYVWGGNGPKGFDCSGFTKFVYNHFGYTINRSASYQINNGVSVTFDELRPGDLVFFKNPGEKYPVSHVGIYIGDGQFIHACSNPGSKKVMINNFSDGSYRAKFWGARRII